MERDRYLSPYMAILLVLVVTTYEELWRLGVGFSPISPDNFVFTL